MRRLPVYFLIDCSDSMVGEPLEAVYAGFEQLVRELRRDPHALETVHLSVITFSSQAEQVLPLTELVEVQTPPFELGPGTAMASAVQVLRSAIDREVRPTTAEQKGDYLPLVFILTDGMPTDQQADLREALAQRGGTRIGNIYGIGCGEDADLTTLEQICDGVFRLDEMSEEQLRSLFMWLTASVRTASVAVGGQESPIDLRKMPEMVSVVPKGQAQKPGEPRVIVLSATCSQTGGTYLMRYVRSGFSGRYRPISVHALDKPRPRGEESVGFASISTSQIEGVTQCAHCGQTGAGVCGHCHALFCLPAEGPDQVECPVCKRTMSLSRSGADFMIHERSD